MQAATHTARMSRTSSTQGDDEAQATADVAGDPYATTTNEDADYAGYAGEGDEVEASLLAV